MYRTHSQAATFTTHVKDAAVKTGFYKIQSDGPGDPMQIEHDLSKIEGHASHAMQRVAAARSWPPDADDRSVLALFMALQLVRTPEHRQQSELMVDSLEKAFYENMTPEWASQRLEEIGASPTPERVGEIVDISKNPDDYLFVPHPNEHLRMMMDLAGKMAPVLAGRSWSLGISSGPALVAGDHAPVRFTRPEMRRPFLGVGLVDAEEVDFPLDRHHALLMFQPGLPEDTFVLGRENILFLNGQTSFASHHFVFQHPDDPSVEHLIPRGPKSLFQMNQEPMFEVDPRTRKRRSPIFSPFFVRDEPEEGLSSHSSSRT